MPEYMSMAIGSAGLFIAISIGVYSLIAKRKNRK